MSTASMEPSLIALDKRKATSSFSSVSTAVTHQRSTDDNAYAPSASTLPSEGCADHLCQKRGCDECGGDAFKPLLEDEFLDTISDHLASEFAELGWAPEKGNPIDYFDEYGDTLLHSAARSGRIEVLKELLSMGAAADTCCQGDCACTPLMVASRWCNLDSARLLIEHGAEISQENANGETSLDQVGNRAVGSQDDRASMIAFLRNTGTQCCLGCAGSPIRLTKP